MKKRAIVKLIIGIILIAIGILTLSLKYLSPTGFIIAEDIKDTSRYILGFWIMIIGIILVWTSREKSSQLEKTIEVFDSNPKSKDKKIKERYYHINDPTLALGSYAVSLGQFRQKVAEFKKDPELYQILVNEYSPKLLEIYHSADLEKRDIAQEFLHVLNIHPEKETIALSSEEKRDIKEAFRDWTGKIDARQRTIMDRYGLNPEGGGNRHYKFRYKNTGYAQIASSSPSDKRTGMNMAASLVKFIEENKRREAEKEKKD